MLGSMALLREAVKAVPAVRYALGIGGVLAAISLVFVLKLDPRIAFIGIIVTLIFMSILVLFANGAAAKNANIRLPSLVFTWFSLMLFMATGACLFTSLFFSWPLNLTTWIVQAQVTPTVVPTEASHPTSQTELPSFPLADSGWVSGGNSPSGYCGPILKAYQNQHPELQIDVQLLPEQHRSEYTPFKHDYYRYTCSFEARRK
jgi:hypothetical protein